MGKYSASDLEIIPISKVKRPILNSCTERHNREEMQRLPYISDPTIIPRVQKYLESNIDKTYVDINVMADDLQEQYREYARRKRSAFRATVKKAYQIVLQSYGIPEQPSSSEEELSDEGLAAEEGSFQKNSMNNQLQDLYNRRPVPNKIDENELIDISSDDTEEDTQPPRKSTNDASTSQPQQVKPVQQQVPGYQNRDQNNVKKEASLNHTASVQGANDRGKKRKAESYVVPYQSSPKKKKSLATLQEPSVTFKDVGGMDKTLEEICKLLMHIRYPEIYRQIGISPPRGFLLHGPPGCGKTLLANAIAGELGIPLLKVAAPELVAGVSGESEERIRELFERAVCSTPCILFIDEIDAITPNRQNAQKEMERRIVAQLLSCLDDLNQNESGDRVLVIGATNRPDSIDPALRRAGRFDREICLGIPDVQAREHILKVLTAKLKLSDDFDFTSLAKYTPGYVGADLMSLTREAALAAVNRTLSSLKKRLKLEQDLAVEKAIAETKKLSEELAADKDKESGNDTSKSDSEIVVDDIVDVTTRPENDKKDTTENSNLSDEPVVVIDDDTKNPVEAVEAEETIIDVVVNGDKQESTEIQVQEPMPVDVKQLTPLEELLLWLHNKVSMEEKDLRALCITMEDFAKALKSVQPSAKREGFATVPDVTWDDIGSLRDIREELQMAILAPVRHSEQFLALGITTPTGVLLCGPPGCGKTLLAKAIANEAGINFISVKGPELLNMYVGESEKAVRVCFQRARTSAPCVIFFDELDALCPKRSDSREGGATMRVVNQMLTEMDGVEGRQGVYILAASNRPDIIDPAVLRPGRLDKILFVGLPTAADRADILRAITKNGTCPPLAPDVDLDVIGKSEQCKGYTGADLAALVREAGVVALKEYMLLGSSDQPLRVNTEHFNRAVAKIRPSVTEKDQKHYQKLRKLYSATPEQNEVEEMEYS